MNTSRRTNWLAVMAATIAGFGLLFARREQTGRIEALVHDAALPGLRLLNRSQSWVEGLPATIEELTARPEARETASHGNHAAELQVRIDELNTEVRQLQAQNAQLLDELERSRSQSASPFVADAGTPLFVPELLNARIVAVGDVSMAIQRASAQRVVDVGQTDGVVPADFVINAGHEPETASRLLIDQGDDGGLDRDQPVFAGRCVIGKVHQVGRWTSSVLPVTDAEYRGRAQLMRRTTEGLVVGSEGILAGDGTGCCRLNFIAATEPVSVGDEVYTAVTGTPLPSPMYYGRVTRAELAEGVPYWDITVRPAETMENARTVQVLRVVLNPSRTNVSRAPEGLPR